MAGIGNSAVGNSAVRNSAVGDTAFRDSALAVRRILAAFADRLGVGLGVVRGLVASVGRSGITTRQRTVVFRIARHWRTLRGTLGEATVRRVVDAASSWLRCRCVGCGDRGPVLLGVAPATLRRISCGFGYRGRVGCDGTTRGRRCRASAPSGSNGPSGSLMQEEVPEPADCKNHDGRTQHDREAIHQRQCDVDRDVPQSGAVVLADQCLRYGHEHEHQQRRLGHGGEQRIVRCGDYGKNATEKVERRKRRGQFSAAAGRIDQNADGGETSGEQNYSPPRQAGDRDDQRSLVQRYPGASTLGCRHTLTLAALAVRAVFVPVVAPRLFVGGVL